MLLTINSIKFIAQDWFVVQKQIDWKRELFIKMSLPKAVLVSYKDLKSNEEFWIPKSVLKYKRLE